MTERTKTRALVVFAVVLLMAVGAQGYQLFGLRHQLARLTGDTGKAEFAGTTREPKPFQLATPAFPDPLSQTPPFDPQTWDPFQELSRMQQHIDAMFNSTFGRFGLSQNFGPMVSQFSFSPKMDLQEKGDEYIVRLEIPGSDNSKINVSVNDNVLTVEAETETGTRQEPGGKMLYQERHIGKFSRTITLPESADAKSLKTDYKDGVYTIRIRKKP